MYRVPNSALGTMNVFTTDTGSRANSIPQTRAPSLYLPIASSFNRARPIFLVEYRKI